MKFLITFLTIACLFQAFFLNEHAFAVSNEHFYNSGEVKNGFIALSNGYKAKAGQVELVNFNSDLFFEKETEGLIRKYDEKIPLLAIKEVIARFYALTGDSHTASDLDSFTSVNLYLDFIVRYTILSGEIKYFAVKKSQNDFLDNSYPLLTHIEGFSIKEIFVALTPYITAGASFSRKMASSIYNLHIISAALGLLNYELQSKKTIKVRLSSMDGKSIEVAAPISDIFFSRKDVRQLIPFQSSDPSFSDNISYVKLMDKNFFEVEDLHTFFQKIMDKKGLILDLRGFIGGGTEIIRELIPYFLDNSTSKYISTYAFCRLEIDCGDDGYGWYPIESNEFDETDRRFLKKKLNSINFDSRFNKELYQSPRFLMVRNNRPYFAGKVVVLIDHFNFSAADQLIKAFAGLKNIILIGTSTTGGSSAPATHNVPLGSPSWALLTIGRALTLDTKGVPIEGNSTIPKFLLYPKPDFFIKKRDHVLNKAKEILTKLIKNKEPK